MAFCCRISKVGYRNANALAYAYKSDHLSIETTKIPVSSLICRTVEDATRTSSLPFTNLKVPLMENIFFLKSIDSLLSIYFVFCVILAVYSFFKTSYSPWDTREHVCFSFFQIFFRVHEKKKVPPNSLFAFEF